jgi:hypothetical protein
MKRQGRPAMVTPEVADEIRATYGRNMPNGQPYTTDALARLYRVSPSLIHRVIERKGPYQLSPEKDENMPAEITKPKAVALLQAMRSEAAAQQRYYAAKAKEQPDDTLRTHAMTTRAKEESERAAALALAIAALGGKPI